jgi:tol-pal system protein YbgF
VKISRHALWVVVASVGACSTPMRAMRADNQRLSQSVAEMRAERRVQDRKIRDLELELAMLKEKAPKSEAVPQLPVEVVAPPASADAARVVGVAEDGTEIVYEGDAALGKPAVIELEPPRRVPVASRDDDRGERDSVRRTPPVSARASRSPVRSDVVSDTAGTDYRAAVELVKTGSKDDAVAALRKFLADHPRHEYADNAQYWLGEAFYGAKDYKNALVEFRATIETYPRGNKVPDALLKVGYCYLALGQTEKARAVLEQVVNLYPKTEPAALAAKRLETP